MLVGFMRNFKQPTDVAKMTSIICKHYGIELIYLRPYDVDIENKTVNGKIFKNNEWMEVERPIPDFIDIAPYCFKARYKKITDFLKENTFLSDDHSNVLTKEKLQQVLKKDKEFSFLVIPTEKVLNIDVINNLLKKFNKIVLKPIKGIQGKNVYLLHKEDNKYVLGYKTNNKILNYEEFEKFVKEEILDNNYIAQKYIESKTVNGHPFDCRVHLEKNGNGEWESARTYIRIGLGQKVISNVNQGGAINDPIPFLKANFPDKWEDINNKIKKLAKTLPYRIEELRKTHIMTIGLDVGIDRNGDLYLFEINDGPATEALKTEVAYLRSNYYKFIRDSKLNEEIRRVIHERDRLKQEISEIKNSMSWKVTKPIRIIRSFIK